MARIDVNEQVVRKFAAPVEFPFKRRVVVWHDGDDSFGDVFAALHENPPASDRPVHVIDVDAAGVFELKRAVYRTYGADDFLLYTRTPRDLSAKGLADNWLADVVIVAEHFQADFASLLMDELGATDGAVEGIEQYKAFFNAQDRKEKFKRLMPQACTKTDVLLGIFGALLAAPDVTTESLVRCYIEAFCDGAQPFDLMAKYGVADAWVVFLNKRLGYAGDVQVADDVSAHVLATALLFQLAEGVLPELEARASLPHGQYCLNVVHDWMDAEGSGGVLYDIARRAEERLNVPHLLARLQLADLADADALPCVNEVLLCKMYERVGSGADSAHEIKTLCRRRKDLRWYTRVENFFEALNCAADAQDFNRRHIQGFHLAAPVDIWEAYTSDWYKMDVAYRKFCRAYDDARLSTSDVPDSASDSLDDLAVWMERVYVNWYLSETNACWVNACENQWQQAGYIEGIARQRRFFEDSVKAGSSDVKKTMVVISDGLRYEVACQLSERLAAETSGSAEMKSMQAVFPSITEFGMAALLPHASMEYSLEDDAVYLNGGMPTVSTENREAVLRGRVNGGKCIKAQKLMMTKRSERKELIGDAQFVYVYHDKIDATGEGANTEHDVFKACDDAIDEIMALVKIATNDLNFTRIVITADHGFLYTRDPLSEHEKVSSKEFVDGAAKVGRRYVVAGAEEEGGALVKVDMSGVLGGSYVGLAPRECIRIKRPGPGVNYVHGGVSLQECCVPVVHFRNRKSGTKGFEAKTLATFSLLSTSRRITSLNFRIELFQKECVGGKVLPADYEIYMTDAGGNEVTEVRKAHADMTDVDDSLRQRRLQFALKASAVYEASKEYFLTCRNRETGQIAWREQYTIDIPFAPIDDFGF